MEPGLPVWTIRPNWRGGILERLEWLTNILSAAASGAEQRRALRLSPRRYIEITVNPTRQERTYLDLLLHSLGSEQWLFPLWFDSAKLRSAVVATGTRVEFDNTFREHGLGGFALLYKDAFTWEVISISATDDEGLDLLDPLTGDWPAGTTIYPLRRARLPMETSLAALTSRVGESVLLFQVVESNDYPEIEPDSLVFESAPVLTAPPNRSEAITLDHVRLAVERDNTVGIPYRADPVDRAFQIQGHGWTVQGREAHAAFRSLLYWLRGRQRSLWLPSFNEDITVTRAAAMSAVNLDIEKIGIAYAGGVIPGRDVVIVNGTPGRITEIGVAPTAAEERLRIGAGLTAAIPAGATGSFMSKCRLNQDAIELLHHTDIDGVMEIAASFQSFADNRDPSGTIYCPIPEAGKFVGQCGSSFILQNPNFEDGVWGWSGTIAYTTSTANGQPPVNGEGCGWPGNNALSEFYQDLSIPSRYLARVDAGLVSVAGYSGYHVKYTSQTDHGQLFISFRDATGAEISRVSSPHDYSNVWTLVTLAEAVIPAGTRKLRFGTRNVRDEGSQNNNYWDAMTPGYLIVAE